MPVSIVRIPKTADGRHQGIDDYLAAGGDLDDLEYIPYEAGVIPAPREWPVVYEECFYGLAGRLVGKIKPNTESDPMAILLLLLSAVGNLIGRHAHFTVEGERHYCKLFVLLVGESSKARKGTAQGRVNRLIERVDPTWATLCQATGLASGEGVVHRVRDRRTKENKEGEVEVVDEGVADKRLYVTEPEFSSL